MALVDNDEVEEVLRVFAVEAGPTFVPGNCLVGCEIHLAAFHRFALDLVPGVLERREDLVLGVVNENVAVGEVQNPRPTVFTCPVPTGTPELPANLEGNEGLSGAGCKREEHARFSL